MLTGLTNLPTYEGVCDSVVTTDERRQVDVEQRLILNAHTPVDHAQIHLRWMAKDERGQRIVGGTSCESQCVETVADKVCRHARCKVADIIAPKNGCTASCCQPEHFPGGHRCWIPHHTVQEQGLPCFCKHVRAIVRCRAIHAQTNSRASLAQQPDWGDARSEPHVRTGTVRDASARLPQARDLICTRVNHVRVPHVRSHPAQVLCQLYWRAAKGFSTVGRLI